MDANWSFNPRSEVLTGAMVTRTGAEVIMIDHDAVFTTEPKRLGKRIAKFRMQMWERLGLAATRLSIRMEGLSLSTTHRMFDAQDDYYGRSRGRITLDLDDLLAKREQEQATQIAGAMLSDLRDVTGPHA